MQIIKSLVNGLRQLREKIPVPAFHICPLPPTELMAVLAQNGSDNLWEQRRCTACRAITHWKRDAPNEPFKLWRTTPELIGVIGGHPGEVPVRADMSSQDLRKF